MKPLSTVQWLSELKIETVRWMADEIGYERVNLVGVSTSGALVKWMGMDYPIRWDRLHDTPEEARIDHEILKDKKETIV